MAGYTEAELTAMLADVKAAITKCLTAQEYQAGAGLSLRRAQLKDLQDREKWLLSELAKFSSTDSTRNTINKAQFERPV